MKQKDNQEIQLMRSIFELLKKSLGATQHAQRGHFAGGVGGSGNDVLGSGKCYSNYGQRSQISLMLWVQSPTGCSNLTPVAYKGCLLLTIIDLATYLVVIAGNITPATEYVKNTAITPPMKRASLTVTRKVFRI